MCSCIECIGDQPEPTAAELEQAAFEKWLRDKCPSGDVESVQRQWLESYEYAELLDEQGPEWQNDVQAAFGGIVQTPQG